MKTDVTLQPDFLCDFTYYQDQYYIFKNQWKLLAKERDFDLVEIGGGLTTTDSVVVVQTLKKRKEDAIAFCLLNPYAWVTAIDRAQEAGIPIVVQGARPPNGVKYPYIGYDEVNTGNELGRETARLFKSLFYFRIA